ncbi:class I SAM-dependent methyltransferase [Okeanomitos corallinicola TIOX110]|uniref:Class I SAM-dependent methyltransferase n=1 Tax=Okeanomitos corallinicola TIOX110 TaxID=3133117 RepID=A0ABZ2UVA5_9CYAN
MVNEYSGITDYYDLLVMSGYYNYQKIASEVYSIIGSGCRILELGVGTGLLVQEYMKIDPNCEFTGVDITQSMIEIAQKRLGNGVTLIQGDAKTMQLNMTFDAVISNGGVWLFLDWGDRWELASHIPNLESNYHSLKNLACHLRAGGLFVLNLQKPGVNMEKSLPDGIVYSQIIEELENTNDYRTHQKSYFFKKNGEILAEEKLMVTSFKQKVYEKLLDEAGFVFQGINGIASMAIYKKR